MNDWIACNPETFDQVSGSLREGSKTYERAKDVFLTSSSVDCGVLLQPVESAYNAAVINFQQYLTSIAEMMSSMVISAKDTKEEFERSEGEIKDIIQDINIEILSSLNSNSSFDGAQ